MNAERMLAHYERIADAPDAIGRLRRFIFDLAVRGKLVPQDAKDEPAVELLRRIAKEKARLVKVGEIKADKPLAPVGDDADFDVPPNWQWTRLGVIASYIQRGKSPKYALADGALVVSQKCVQWAGLDLTVAKQVTFESLADYELVRFLRDGDLLWNSTGTGTIGRVIRLVKPPEKLVCDSHVTVVRCPEVNPEYVRTWLRSDHVYALIEGRASGSTNQVELTAQMAINQVFPLPPLGEQHRIVAKVDELMALCDWLEAARAEREAARDRLSASSLARLNTPDPDTFQADARVVLNALPALTTRPDQIKQLRQTILNLAVRGKLVPQDAKDEPVAELLKRIEIDKNQLINKGAIRKRDELPEIADYKFAVPPKWLWCRLGSLGWTQTGTTPPKSKPDHYGDFVPFIKPGDIYSNYVDYGNEGLSEQGVAESGRIAGPGSILMVCIGTIGKCQRIDRDCSFNQQINAISPFSDTDSRFLLAVFQSDLFQNAAWAVSARTTIAILNKGNWELLAVPLPPVAEQHRIVAKVDELFSLCDQLEASLNESSATRSRLLDSLLAESLEPAELVTS